MEIGYRECDDYSKLLDFCVNNSKKKLDYQECIHLLELNELDFSFDNYHVSMKYDNLIFQFNFKSDTNISTKFIAFIDVLKKYNKKNYLYNDQMIDTHIDNDVTWFNLKQITTLLGYASSSYLANYYRTYNIKMKTKGKKCYVDQNGLIEILNRSRKPNAKQMMKDLGLNLINKKESIEANYLKQIQDFLEGNDVEYKLQYSIGEYSIDMYLVDEKIAIEIDENGHADRDPNYEKNRETFIKENLTEKILRINPNKVNFRMAKELGILNRMMH